MRVDDATQQRAVGGWRAERAVDDVTQQRAVAAGQERGEQQRLAWIHGQGSQHQTPEQRGEAAWDRVQRK